MPHYELIRPARQTFLRRLADALRSVTLGPFNPKDREIARLFSDSAPHSGVSVNEESSMTFAAVWNAVVLISSDVAKVPLPLYRRLPDGGKETYRDHRLYELLHDEPNPETSSFKFRQTMQGHTLLWGGGYAEIERDDAGRPVALWPMMPWSVQPFRNTTGGLKYRVYQPSGGEIVFDRQDVLHLSGFGVDAISGYAPIRKAIESLGIAIATQQFAAAFFGNGSTFGGIISYPAGVATNEQTRKENRKAIESRHQGVDRSHRLLTLYEGATYTQMGIPPDAAQFLETRRFQVEEVARWFNIPVHKLKELARSTNNNIEHQSIEYATDTLQPWFRMWEGELRLKLIPRLERKIQFFEHVTEALIRGDSAAQGDLVSKQFSVGGISPNEIRSKFNYNPRPDGNDIYVPSNTMPADIARRYWEAQIEATLARATAPKDNVFGVEEAKSLRDAIVALRDEELEAARRSAQEWEDRYDKEHAERGDDVEALKAMALAQESLQQKAEKLAGEAHALVLERATLTQRAETAEAQLFKCSAERDGLALDNDTLTAKLASEQEALRAEQAHHAITRAATQQQITAFAEDLRDVEQERDAIQKKLDEAVVLWHSARSDLERTISEQREQIAKVSEDQSTQAETRRQLEVATEAMRVDADSLRSELAAEREARQTQRTVWLAAMRSLFADATERLLQREIDRARKNQQTPDKLRTWAERFYETHAEIVRDAFRPLVGPWTAITGGAPSEMLERLVTEHVQGSQRDLRLVLDEDDPDAIAAALERTLRRWESERPDAMADALVREGMQV